MPSISSERVSWNRRASVASFAAYESAPDPRRLEPAGARDDEAAREHLVARGLVERVALAGEQRLVDLEPVGGAHDAVARDLVAGAQLEQVVEHDHRRDRDLLDVPVAHDPGTRRVQHRELVERPLGPHLLEDADGGVGDEDDAERGVLDRADHHDHRERAPRMALNRVNTLARTISPRVRLVRSPVSLVCPRATRSCTSAAVRPVVAGARRRLERASARSIDATVGPAR